jgi:excisionase family DNA binding protein
MPDAVYTLRELSEDLDMSIKELRRHIRRGKLPATKIGRTYYVAMEDLETFLEENDRVPERYFMCRHYDRCLDDAARCNREFDCTGCLRFVRTETMVGAVPVLSDMTLGGNACALP